MDQVGNFRLSIARVRVDTADEEVLDWGTRDFEADNEWLSLEEITGAFIIKMEAIGDVDLVLAARKAMGVRL